MLTFLAMLFTLGIAETNELPKRYDIQKVDLKAVPLTQNLYLKAKVEIPPGFHSTQFATLDIYEKKPGGWFLLTQIKQKDRAMDVFNGNNDLSFEQGLHLESENSEVAFDLSVSFCNKICVINNFQGIAKRDPKAKSNHIEFLVKGQTPEERMKAKGKKVALN